MADGKPISVPVTLVPPDPRWPEQAQAEIARLRQAIPEGVVRIEHIGSTAIPDIMAKPTIDLLPLVTDLALLDARADAIRALGYEWHGEFGLVGRRFFTLNKDGKRLFNVHGWATDNPEVTRHLAFRDYLRSRPDLARDYEKVKIRAAELQPNNVDAYNDEKNDWIKQVEKDALAWYARR